jgi:hypothetical protein
MCNTNAEPRGASLRSAPPAGSVHAPAASQISSVADAVYEPLLGRGTMPITVESTGRIALASRLTQYLSMLPYGADRRSRIRATRQRDGMNFDEVAEQTADLVLASSQTLDQLRFARGPAA